MKIIFRASLAAIVLVAMFAAGIGIQALGREFGIFPFTLINSVAEKVNRKVTELLIEDEDRGRLEFSSIFGTIEGRSVDIPRPRREGIGGAMTSVGNEVIVLTFDGQVFVATPDGSVVRSGIETPPNGFENYLAAIERPEYREFNHRPDRFRYNDIAYHDGPLGTRILVSYLRWHASENCFRTIVSQFILERPAERATSVNIARQDWETLYETSPCLPLRGIMTSIQGEEAGGRLAFSPNGEQVYLANGDYGWNGYHSDGRHPLSSVALAQDDGNDYGKVIEIDLATGSSRHFSKGHRNPQGIAFDNEGHLWVAEHGPRGGDELNLVRDGGNYGWPFETYGTDYDGSPIPTATSVGRHETYAKPVYSWLPSIATGSLASTKNFNPAWDGDLLVGALRGEAIYRIRLDGERVVFAEHISLDRRVRDIVQLPNGMLAIWTDWFEVFFLQPAEGEDAILERALASVEVQGAVYADLEAAARTCLDCHAFAGPEHRIGPSLRGVVERPVAATTFASYSNALAATSGRWTEERLKQYIRAPQETVPGTSMPDLGIEDDAVLDALIALLQETAMPARARR